MASKKKNGPARKKTPAPDRVGEPTADAKRMFLRDLDEKGSLDADAVVEAARNPSNPYHKSFDWDDARVAHRQRVDQARGYIAEYRSNVTFERHDFALEVQEFTPIIERCEDGGVKPTGRHTATDRIKRDEDACRDTLRYFIQQARGDMKKALGYAVDFGSSHAEELAEALRIYDGVLEALLGDGGVAAA